MRTQSCRQMVVWACTATVLLAGSMAQSSEQKPDWSALSGADPIKSLMVVDCLLPGQMRRSGRMSYIGPALPVKTTAELCEKRGGEYVEYDRASLQSTLKVWNEKAEAGDPEAQLFVAQAYERGIDRAPDPAKAAEWYAKAAKNGSREAKLSLAALMEEGRGVPADPEGALKLYREAMGLDEELVRASQARQEVTLARMQLESARADADARIARLQSEVTALADARDQETQRRQAKESELAALTDARDQETQSHQAKESELIALTVQRAQTLEKLAALPPASPTRSVSRAPSSVAGAPPTLSVEGKPFGRYYALVVGVEKYDHLAPLKTPIADAEAVADVLQRRYGFETTLLRNPDYYTLTGELVRVLANRKADDNVLIYFAGHGELDGKEGFWLPRDATQTRESALPNSLLVSSMTQFAGRTLLVIADSCFGAALAAPREISGPLEYSPEDSASFLANKGRYVISAGGETPVIDDGGNGHSVFTSELLRVLESNDRVLTQRGLAIALKQGVEDTSRRLGQVQVPEVAPMRDGRGYEGGKFYLVPAEQPASQVSMVD